MAVLSAQKVSGKKFENLRIRLLNFLCEKNRKKIVKNSGRDPPQSALEVKLSYEFCILRYQNYSLNPFGAEIFAFKI